MGLIRSAKAFGAAVWDISRKVAEGDVLPMQVIPLMLGSAQFNTDLMNFHKAMNGLDQTDSALANFKERILADCHQTVNSRSDAAVMAIDVPTVYRKLVSHADAICQILPNHPTAEILRTTTRAMEDNFASLTPAAKAFIERDIRRETGICPMQIMADMVADEAQKQFEASQKLDAIGYDRNTGKIKPNCKKNLP
jgi:hypothetical protein